jgi:hypothetical protein
MGAGGTSTNYGCAAGNSCPDLGSYCASGGFECFCTNGVWGFCSFVGSGGAGTGGSGNLPGFQIYSGGYVVSGNWHGYAWTAGVTSAASGAGITTITPISFSGVSDGATELCVAGSIGAAPDYGGVAVIGVEVNQPRMGPDGGDPQAQTVAIGGSGVTVSYTNPGATSIRVQIQTLDGATSPTGRWCATLLGSGGTETVPWSSFWGGVTDGTKGCWNSGGNNPPLGTQIESVGLVVPGSNMAAVPFSFCLTGIAQAS